LLQKPGNRPAALILRAFNIELSRARTVLAQANPSVAAGKFAFWRDLINDAGRVVEHPVAESLQWLLRNHQLDRQRLLSIVDAKVHWIAHPARPISFAGEGLPPEVLLGNRGAA
jgi:phytoene/squalene synthetase